MRLPSDRKPGNPTIHAKKPIPGCAAQSPAHDPTQEARSVKSGPSKGISDLTFPAGLPCRSAHVKLSEALEASAFTQSIFEKCDVAHTISQRMQYAVRHSLRLIRMNEASAPATLKLGSSMLFDVPGAAQSRLSVSGAAHQKASPAGECQKLPSRRCAHSQQEQLLLNRVLCVDHFFTRSIPTSNIARALVARRIIDILIIDKQWHHVTAILIGGEFYVLFKPSFV